jgi:hypothetical protein
MNRKFLSKVGYVVTRRPGVLTVTSPTTRPDPGFPSSVAGVQMSNFCRLNAVSH